MAKVTKIHEQPTPEVGMGATTGYGSDRYPYTVVEILSKRKIKLQADSFKRIDNNGMSEVQEYNFYRDVDGHTDVATLRKDGTWVSEHDPLKHGRRFWLGQRSAHFDPHF